MASSAGSVISSTDSYPGNFRSFSTPLKDDGISSTDTENPFASELEKNIQSRTTGVPKLKWDKEQFDVRRPYERKNYERAYRTLPGHLAAFEGLNVPVRKCTVPSAFTRRTPIEEVFHKRNVKSVCQPETSRTIENCVEDVIVADNMSSTESSVVEKVENEIKPVTEGRIVSKECCKTFFRARRTLLRSELFQEYFTREPTPVKEEESDESEDGLDELQHELEVHECSVDRAVPATIPHHVRSTSIGSYQPPTITHRDDKVAAIEAQEQFLKRMRSRYLEKFDRFTQRLEEAEQERFKPPELFDAEKYETEYPKPDIRNEEKIRFRDSLRKRLEELTQLQQRTVRKYPTSVKQFAAYKAQIMEDRRKLRDEALLVEQYFRNANTPKELPEAKIEVKHYRLADFGVHPSDSEDEEDREANERKKQNEPLVYHTCMTREEWGHWVARSTKIEKLKLPKPTIPRIPVLVQECVESPIRAYVQGRLQDGNALSSALPEREEKGRKREEERLAQSQKIIHSIQLVASSSRKSMVKMRDLLFDPMTAPEPMNYVPYNASLLPYSDIAEERFRSVKGQRKVQRQLRKSRMHWIEELVDEICRRKRY